MMPVLTYTKSRKRYHKKKNYKPVSHINIYTKYWQIKCNCILKRIYKVTKWNLIPRIQGWFNVRISTEHTTLTEWRKRKNSHDHLNWYRENIWQNPTTFMIKPFTNLWTEGIFLNMIKSIYEKSTANIIINSKKPKAFPLRSGERWGCPLLPLLFNTVLKVLVRAGRI